MEYMSESLAQFRPHRALERQTTEKVRPCDQYISKAGD